MGQPDRRSRRFRVHSILLSLRPTRATRLSPNNGDRGLNDPRVTYWEPAKYVAKLRALKTDHSVLLLKTNMGAGHGGRSGRYDRLYEVAEEYGFILASMGLLQ